LIEPSEEGEGHETPNRDVGWNGCAGFGLLGTLFRKFRQGQPIPLIVDTLALLSQPGVGVVTVLYPDLPIGLSLVLMANVATYALVGMIVETLRRHYPSNSGKSQA